MARLIALHDLKDFKVANDNLDVRGWEVIGSDGQRIGQVDDLIVDRELMKVRYLDVDVDKNRVLPDTDARHILLPIGAAQLDDDSDQVFVAMDQNALSRFPFYKGGTVDAEYEYRVMHAITSPNENYVSSSATPLAAPAADFYTRDHFDENRFYRNRSRHHDHHSTRETQHQTTTSGQGLGGSPIQDDIATIERLRQMLEQGTITEEEFAALKRKAIGI
ncbi:hypothetical protein GCM10027189_37790 [Rufibacter soli]